MARASEYTSLSLDRFAQLVGIHPLHFNQVEVQLPSGNMMSWCGTPIVQYSWQSGDRIGREEIALAIKDAESLLETYLGFPLAPKWIVNEVVQVPRPAKPELFNGWGLDSRGLPVATKTEMGYVISGGKEAFTLLAAGSPVVYSDTDGDGYYETATITATVPIGTLADEIAIYYPGTLNPAASLVDPTWEIRPRKVQLSPDGLTATITCRREQLLDADYMLGLNPTAQDGLVAGNFLGTVDVFRHWTDPSNMVSFIWEQMPLMSTFGDPIACDNCGGPSGSCPSCSFLATNGCVAVRDSRQGLVSIQPGTWNASNGVFDYTVWPTWRMPDRISLCYRAGYTRPADGPGYVDPKFERAIAYLALARMDRLICGCNLIKGLAHHWQEDIAQQVLSQGSGTSFKISPSQLANPFGTTRGGIYAWNLIQPERKGEAVLNA